MKKLLKKTAVSDLTFESFSCVCSTMCNSSCGTCPSSCSETLDLSDVSDDKTAHGLENLSDNSSIYNTVKY